MQVPICRFDAKNAVLCPQCESKVESGELTKADVEASIKLSELAKKNTKIDKFKLHRCRQVNGDYIIHLDKNDIFTIRQSRELYKLIQSKFDGKIWLVEADESDNKFIEDLFFPTKLLSVNSVWQPNGGQKTKAIISGKWSPRFPIDIDKAIEIIKNARNLDIEIEFEEARK
ncbi:transcription elongation factor NusA [Nitrosopumilus sp. b1]|uniref:transcription elongation factor NusA n=1 Tax=Nitrosopumilus sp. b1 TaxID=2109907 RepID=UPI0015F708D2|nr:transcription elongation factor NusA [Nitrosopumilus sp. b1]KAF6242451.1 transcription elongation factor NusA [Nitrosopumilus sp. b1]